MFAVIKTGGKQYKVAADNRITVMSLEGDAGARVTFAEVLALFDGETSQIGAPFVAGASVVGEIVEQTRGAKVIAFKKRRRKNSRRKRGHKQDSDDRQDRGNPDRRRRTIGRRGDGAGRGRDGRRIGECADGGRGAFGSGGGGRVALGPRASRMRFPRRAN